jgi:retron-type reverse transcriptase
MKVVHNSYDQLISLENIFDCWREFRKGKSKKPDVMEFEHHLEDNIFQLNSDLVSRTYRHGPYHTFHIYDPKFRIISKATIRDRLVHYLVFKELYRIFDPSFIYHSYSSRLGKGTHLAVSNLAKILRKISQNYRQPTFALKCDIRQFFHSVSHQKLLAIIKRKVKDEKFFWLVQAIINSFSSSVDNFPQGGGIK